HPLHHLRPGRGLGSKALCPRRPEPPSRSVTVRGRVVYLEPAGCGRNHRRPLADAPLYDDPTHFEVVVDEAALEYLDLIVGTDYIYTAGAGANQIELTLHVVGAF